MDENEIRVADAAGVQIRLRYISATHEVEVLDATGRPKLKSVLREPVRFDGKRLVINNRTSALTDGGSTIDEVATWSIRAHARPPVVAASSGEGTPAATPATARMRRRARKGAELNGQDLHGEEPGEAELQVLNSVVGDVLMVLGLLAALGGLIVAANSEGLTSAARFTAVSSRQLAAGVLIACVSTIQVAVVLFLRRVRPQGTFV
jgi:hypothetical protein